MKMYIVKYWDIFYPIIRFWGQFQVAQAQNNNEQAKPLDNN